MQQIHIRPAWLNPYRGPPTPAHAASPAKQAARITTAVVSILSAGMLQLTPVPVQAANYGGFGSTYSEVGDPKKAEMSETYKSEEVKIALEGVNRYTSVVATMRADLVSH
jgi:hypothetical protein